MSPLTDYLTYIVGFKRFSWFSHVNKMPEERLPKYLLDWKPKYGIKRSRGRPRKSFKNEVYIEDAERRLDRSGVYEEYGYRS